MAKIPVREKLQREADEYTAKHPHPKKGWKRADSARFKLEQMLTLTANQLVEIANDERAPLFERRIARTLIKENNWAVTASIIDEVYGKPKETVEAVNLAPARINISLLSGDASEHDAIEAEVVKRAELVSGASSQTKNSGDD